MRVPRWLPAALAMWLPLVMTGQQQERQSAAAGGVEFRDIESYVTRRMRSARIPGLALAIVRDDSIVFLKGYGRSDPSGRPVTPQTPFAIGSITKPFTALATMQLVEAGKIDLDAPVQRYMHWFRVADADASSRITVRQLLIMTSGIPQSYTSQLLTANDDGALERNVRSLASVKLSRRPGEAFVYANANYEALGLLVQTVSGESYEEYVRRHIFEPLDMHDTFTSQEEAQRHGMASGHRWWFGFPIAVTFPYNRAELPAGYIIASTENMAHFLVAQLNAGRYGDKSILSPDGIAYMQSETEPDRYGPGWEAIWSNGRRLVNHDGGTANFQSALFFDPVAKVGVYVAANVVNALDTFSSPHGTSPLDGVTARSMAHVILSMATDQPLPDQGRGHERLTLAFNLVVLVLTMLVVALLRRSMQRLRGQQAVDAASRAGSARHRALVAAGYFAFPAVVAYLACCVAPWRAIAMFQPDLAWWLYTVAIVLFLRGVLELWSAGRSTRESARRQEPAVT